jgi:folylpolyglutamate synthase/dihydropteroate synthase
MPLCPPTLKQPNPRTDPALGKMDPLEYLLALEKFGIKFGLENIRTLTAAIGNPQTSFRSVLVAGTNGKGSVTAIVDGALRAAGLRVGRYTSPHLIHLEERFTIGGTPVATPVLVAAVDEMRAVIEALLARGALEAPPTFFEVTTAVAFELFRRAGVEFASAGGSTRPTSSLRLLRRLRQSISITSSIWATRSERSQPRRPA